MVLESCAAGDALGRGTPLSGPAAVCPGHAGGLREAAWVPEQQRRPVLGWDKALERGESFCSLGSCFSRPS